MRWKKQIFDLTGILAGAYYIIAELITIYKTKEGFLAYRIRSISELGINESPLHSLMNSALILNGIVFSTLVTILALKRYNKTTALLAFLTGVGTLGVGLFPVDGNIYLHYISTALVFAAGNILNIISGIYEDSFTFKLIFITNGTVGLLSAFLLFFIKPLLPIFERLTVYPIVIYQILLSLLFLLQKKDAYKHP